MFPEHVERSFLDPEYSFDEYFQLGSRRKVGPIKNQLASPNTSNLHREETFAQLRTGLTQGERKNNRSTYPSTSIAQLSGVKLAGWKSGPPLVRTLEEVRCFL